MGGYLCVLDACLLAQQSAGDSASCRGSRTSKGAFLFALGRFAHDERQGLTDGTMTAQSTLAQTADMCWHPICAPHC